MGQDYDPSWEFTVADLLSFHLGRYKDLIAAICAGAAAEYALELRLNQLARAWQEKDFKLAKHIPLMRPRMRGDQSKSAKGKRKTKQAGHGAEVRTVMFRGTSITNDLFQPSNSVMYDKEPRYNELLIEQTNFPNPLVVR